MPQTKEKRRRQEGNGWQSISLPRQERCPIVPCVSADQGLKDARRQLPAICCNPIYTSRRELARLQIPNPGITAKLSTCIASAKPVLSMGQNERNTASYRTLSWKRVSLCCVQLEHYNTPCPRYPERATC